MKIIQDLKCQQPGCDKDADYGIHVILVFTGNKKNLPTTRMGLVCEEHKNLQTLEEFVSKKSWQQLIDQFNKVGKMLPSREKSFLSFRRLGPI